MTLYHALMESILMDEDAMDQGVADLDKQKKRKPADGDRDKDLPAGSEQGLKKRKTSKDAEPSKKPKSTGSSKDNTQSQPKSTSKSAQAKETIVEAKDTDMPLHQGDDLGNANEQPNVEADPKQDWQSRHDVYSTMRILSVTSVTVYKWYSYGHLKEINVRRADNKLYKFMEGNFPRLHLNDIEDMLLLVV
ncbi:hypothetical protein Tco_1188802 [Tanacetum coccineum]